MNSTVPYWDFVAFFYFLFFVFFLEEKQAYHRDDSFCHLRVSLMVFVGKEAMMHELLGLILRERTDRVSNEFVSNNKLAGYKTPCIKTITSTTLKAMHVHCRQRSGLYLYIFINSENAFLTLSYASYRTSLSTRGLSHSIR